ncbi:MAG: Cof-type HAD-IIB family hydrolase [Dehalococcoidia bacterium]|nr:Cof-type HAD-IIB family hydrolase [Dehalococcoidia bacterium]
MLPEQGGRPSYHLVALDLDDTLLDRDLVLSPRVERVIREIMDAGVMVTLSTGRMFQSALPYAQRLGIAIPIICYQGALIKDPTTRQVLFHQPVPLKEARQVIRIVRGWGLHINVYVDDELYVESVTAEAERYVNIARVALHPVGDLLAFLTEPPTKLVIVSDEASIDRAMGELRAIFGETIYITKSLPIFCEIANPGCNKGNALAALASRLGVTQEETVAIGDGLNDLEMVQWAGLGIAMGNAPPELKGAAGMITGTIKEDGAAQALEDIFLVTRASK